MFGGEILLAGYINQRLIGEFKAGKSFRKLFRKYLRILFVSSLFFVSASVVFLKFFASKFFGNEYSIFSESSIYYFPLAFSQAITSSLHISLNLINKEKIQALWNFTRGLILCFMTVFFLKFEYPSYIFVLNVGILNLVMSLIFFSIVYLQIYRHKKV